MCSTYDAIIMLDELKPLEVKSGEAAMFPTGLNWIF
jgi:hypothetical protein